MYVFLRFFTFFFQNPKIHDFLRFFELLHTFSRTVMVENAGLENGATAFYGTPCITYVCSVLQDATNEQ